MQTKYKNKAISADEAKNKAEAPPQEFHFAGDGEYYPITIKARSPEEAEKEWIKQRKKVESSQKINES